VTFNDLLQGKFLQAASDLSRIMFNTTAGLFGIVDVSSSLGLPKHNEDFGQTLGHWGVPAGPYLVLPLLGPSTVRDTAALPVDWYSDPLWLVEDPSTYWSAVAVRAVDDRAELLRAGNILEDAALDPYVFMREAVLQRRQSLVYDGNPPKKEGEEFDIFEEDGDAAASEEPSAAPEEGSPTP
jgi:phospholipid-binding lipoprotein MlaA